MNIEALKAARDEALANRAFDPQTICDIAERLRKHFASRAALAEAKEQG